MLRCYVAPCDPIHRIGRDEPLPGSFEADTVAIAVD